MLNNKHAIVVQLFRALWKKQLT